MAIKIYGTPPSGPARRAIAAAEEKGLDYEFVVVDTSTAQHKKQPYISINPFGQVPGLEDGETKVFESRAIAGYIAHTYAGQGTPLVPSDPKEWTAVIQWSEVESQQFDPTASKLSFELVIKAIFGRTTDEAAVEELKAKLGGILDVYEARLKESKFLAGDSFTIADLNHLPHVDYLYGTKIRALFEARPNVDRWGKEILARPAWKRTLAAVSGSK